MGKRKRIYSQERADIRTNVRSKERNILDVTNKGLNSIGHSGNSDVDVKIDVNVDTTAIGFAILCSLYATGQMNNDEFQNATRILGDLTNKEIETFLGQDVNSLTNLRLFKSKKR